MTSKQTSLLAAFLAAKVEFAVVGGVAVILHGYLRTTNDLDIFIRPTRENAAAAFFALQAVNAPLENIEADDLLSDDDNLRFGPNEDHIDILSSIGEMSFDQVWRDRETLRIDGIDIPIISKADLILNKQQTGRLRDLADVEELLRIPDEHPFLDR